MKEDAPGALFTFAGDFEARVFAPLPFFAVRGVFATLVGLSVESSAARLVPGYI